MRGASVMDKQLEAIRIEIRALTYAVLGIHAAQAGENKAQDKCDEARRMYQQLSDMLSKVPSE